MIIDLILRKTPEGAWRPLIKRLDVASGDEKTVVAGPLCEDAATAQKYLLAALKKTAKDSPDE
jgi:hypothetical protein